MKPSEFLIRDSDRPACVSPETVGWDWLSFHVVELDPGTSRHERCWENEIALVPLTNAVEVRSQGRQWVIGGRPGVFEGLPQALYLPAGSQYQICSVDGRAEVAVCGARANTTDLEPVAITENDYTCEIRGAGNATRQVVTLIGPDFPAERLIVVEVWTPSGNWSSYPPHKHDRHRPPEELCLEETYYYRIKPSEGFAVQRLYSPDREVDESWIVRDGDLLTVPWGFHTTAAVPGYDLYYLNVLAGEQRGLTAFEDPRHAWVRRSWREHPTTDSRLPLVAEAS